MNNYDTKKKILTTVFEMISDRGYNNIKYGIWNDSYSGNTQDECMISSNSVTISEALDSDIIKLGDIVFGNIEENKIAVRFVYEYSDTMFDLFPKDTEYRILVIFSDKKIKNINVPFRQIFSYNTLIYNATKHKLVPKHELLKMGEEYSFIKKEINNIPTILRDDPIAKYYGYEHGDICKITRNNYAIVYRRCVN